MAAIDHVCFDQMIHTTPERVLLIGDTRHDVYGALLEAVPGVQITSVTSVFDGIAELAGGGYVASTYTTVIAAAEPIERRPEAAVRTLRQLSGDSRLVLFGHSTLELLSRKMLQHGCDDYLITPASIREIQQVMAAPAPQEGRGVHEPSAELTAVERRDSELAGMSIASIALNALLNRPEDSIAAAIEQMNNAGVGGIELLYRADGEADPQARAGRALLSHPLNESGTSAGIVWAYVKEQDAAARHALAQAARIIEKIAALQARHLTLQRMAITDDLTGVYNGRYFRHFLNRIVKRAEAELTSVTLLLFDIDDFKHYNDRHGHVIGDEILKQTATVMKRCTREHDLVARVGGDEFAVVFWDKEGPRQPRDPKPGVVSRPPHDPKQVFERFKTIIASDAFTALGPSGQGLLGISAGLAVYPWHATDAASLIREADRALMQGAKKKSGKNSLFIVGSADPDAAPEEATS